MTQPLSKPVFVILCDDEGTGRIAVDLEAFVRFTAQLDADLGKLEARWSHLSPRGIRSPRRSDQARKTE